MANPNYESPSDKSARIFREFHSNVIISMEDMLLQYKNNPEFKIMVDNINSSRQMLNDEKMATDDFFIKQFTQ